MRKIYLTGQLVILTLLIATTALAEPAESWGPDIGSVIPGQLETLDQDGNSQSFQTLVGEKGLTIVFLRSVDWCPYCKRQAIELEMHADEFAARGTPLITISYDSLETLTSFKLKHAPGLQMLSDPQSVVIKAFGILNQKPKPGSRGYGIPNPGIIIVDTEGVIRAKFADKSYRDRPKTEAVLKAIDELDL